MKKGFLYHFYSMVSHYKENTIEQGKPMMGIILNDDKKNEKITALNGFAS